MIINLNTSFALALFFFLFTNHIICQQYNKSEELSPEFRDTLIEIRKLPKNQQSRAILDYLSRKSKRSMENSQEINPSDIKNEEKQNYQSSASYGGTYTFDTEKTNFSRFKNSPCYDQIGFDPFSLKTAKDVESLEKLYEECEAEKNNVFYFKVLFAVLFVCVIVTVFYYLGKRK